MNLITASRKHFLSDETIRGFVVEKVYKLSLLEKLDGTGGSAIVTQRGGYWANPDSVKTSMFPVLQVDCYADATRTPQGEIREVDAADKAEALWLAVDRLIHGVRAQVWGGASGLRIVTCARFREPDLFSAQDPGKTTDKDLGDVVYLSGQYAMELG